MQRSLFVLSFALLLATVSWAQVVPMTNDECSTATSVFDGVNPNAPVGASGNVFTNVGATASAGSPACGFNGTSDVWFLYVPLVTGSYTIETCTPPGFAAAGLADTLLSVLDGSVCPAVTSLACNDDTCGLLSRVTVCFTAGAPYYIRVAGYNGTSGNFYVNIVAAPPAVLPNDDCAGAIALATGPNGPFSNTGAANSCVAASCGFGGSPGYQDVWFSYVPTCSGNLTIDTGCTAGLDTILTAYAACGGPELGCNDDAGGSCGLNSSITVPATAGSPVLIRVSSYANGTTGSFPINILPGGGMALGFSSPFGPGSIQIDITGGPPSGGYFLALTFFAGVYPGGWLFGVDLPLPELQNLLTTGFPFLGPLTNCGSFTIGPFGGLGFLSGLPVFAVALGLPPGSSTPSMHSSAVTYTIP